MKPALQVPLAIALVAVLVYLMYWQGQDKDEVQQGSAGRAQGVEASGETQEASEEGSEAGIEEESATGEEGLELDALVDDEPEALEQPGPASPAPQKTVDKDQARRASASLRERRRNMFKKIDVSEKDGVASKVEHDVFFQNAFDFYDKNKDGRLTGKELGQVRRLPRHADRNKDRVLTRKEFLDQFERFFVIMDVDKSGDLTEKEFVR